MTTTPGSLRPVSGSPPEVERLVRAWLDEPAPRPLTIRTSGSSGRPKDVELTAAALCASATATLARLGGPGSWLLALPAHYVAGLQVIVRSILASTSPVVLADHADLAAATDALPAGRRYAAIVPTQLHRWLALPRELEALRRYDAVLVGGAAAPPGLLERASQGGVRVVTTYGMTETCGGCVYDGVALDGVAVALAADGAIRLSGPVLFDGYAGDAALTRRVLGDGWFATADLGRFDPDGRLVVLGRADDVVVSGGVNVAVSVVEARVAEMPGVVEAAVVAVPDDEWGVRLVAVVVTTGPLALDAVRDFVAEHRPRAWAPRELMVVGELPRLDSGKVDRRLLREALGGSRG